MNHTFQVGGRQITISEQELVAFVEEFFRRFDNTKAIQGPTEGEWFGVTPMDINQDLFRERRGNKNEEELRQLILDAFNTMNHRPKKYLLPFMTMVPKKTWTGSKTDAEFKELASSYGGHIGDWVEQALQWAQRIHNGESWDAICSDQRAPEWFRQVYGKEGYKIYITGSRKYDEEHPPTNPYCRFFDGDITKNYAVPLIVI